MYFVAFVLAVAAGAFYVAGTEGIWAHLLCRYGSMFCQRPVWLAAARHSRTGLGQGGERLAGCSSAPSCRRSWGVTHCFDVVTIGVEHEGGVVIRVVMRAQAWRRHCPCPLQRARRDKSRQLRRRSFATIATWRGRSSLSPLPIQKSGLPPMPKPATWLAGLPPRSPPSPSV